MEEYSVVDNKFPVNADLWVISIMRKSEGENPEHAFLMVEGRNSFGMAVLRRYDLFLDKEKPGNKCLIYIKPEIIVNASEAKTCLLEDILRGEEVYAISWSFTKNQAEYLRKDILKDKKNPPDYQISGDKSVVAKSSGKEGHSCFSWAREKLHNLNDDRIRLPEKYTDFVAAKTSLYIKGKPEPTSENCLIL